MTISLTETSVPDSFPITNHAIDLGRPEPRPDHHDHDAPEGGLQPARRTTSHDADHDAGPPPPSLPGPGPSTW